MLSLRPMSMPKRYGKVVEIMASICTIISFLCLLAGNLVGMGAIISYLLDMPQAAAIWVSIKVQSTIVLTCLGLN